MVMTCPLLLQVHVWWVDGSTSVCFPQDLYKVGEYDSDDGELWDGADDSSMDSDDAGSWRTTYESDGTADEADVAANDGDAISLTTLLTEGGPMLKTRLVGNIEKARVAMSRLEEIFTQNPGLQSTQVMRQLLDCYKECRSVAAAGLPHVVPVRDCTLCHYCYVPCRVVHASGRL